MCNTQKKPVDAHLAATSGKGFKSGATFVEVAIAIVVMIISLLGVSSAYVSGRKQIVKQVQYQQAINLACEELEDIKAKGYSALVVDEDGRQNSNEEIQISGFTFVRYTTTELTAQPTADVPNPCKKVTVTIQWTARDSDTHQVKLITYLGP